MVRGRSSQGIYRFEKKEKKSHVARGSVGEGWGRRKKKQTGMGMESGTDRWKVMCVIRGFSTVPYGVDVPSGTGGVVVRRQLHGAEDLG